MMKKLLWGILLSGMVFTFTNYIYISAVPSLVSLIVFPVVILYKRRVHVSIFWLMIFFLISLVNTALYYPESFLQFGYYRYDGNFIISYAPLLFFPFLHYRFDIEKLFRKLLLLFLVINLVLLAMSYGFNPHTSVLIFKSLFKASNAAGGFFSIMASCAFAFWYASRKRWDFVIFSLYIFLTVLTSSRGSMLGIVLGIFMFYCFQKKFKWIITVVFLSIVVLQVGILFHSYPLYKIYTNNSADKQTIHKFYQQYEGNNRTKFKNILLRVYEAWPHGLNTFLDSPLLGTGFGSFNDGSGTQNMQGIRNLYMINQSPHKAFNSSHAHHSYLHILAEQGILGLLVFLTFWINLFKYIVRNKSNITMRNFLLIAFFNLSVMSFTEHRITSPSNVLPFVLSLSLYFVYSNSINSIKQIDHNQTELNEKDLT